MALLLYLVQQHCTGPESIPELVRSQPSCLASDCGSKSVLDSDGGRGVTKEGSCNGSEDMAWWDMARSSSNVTRRVGDDTVGKA